jgi:UDP-4-amino-4,6-dideoxy-N-acetyl-beta-L-altrosamine N-acetyltransferase
MECNKQTTYKNGDYLYKNFIILSEDEKQMILSWRNHENVRKWMYNSDIIPLQNHLKFMESLKERGDCYYWLVLKNNEPYGVVNIVDIDFNNNSGEIGLYRNPFIDDDGGGLDFFYNYFSFLFFTINVEIIYGGVQRVNKIAMLLNAFLGMENMGEKVSNNVEYFALRLKKDNIDNWDTKNDITKMLDYFGSSKFAKWKVVDNQLHLKHTRFGTTIK